MATLVAPLRAHTGIELTPHGFAHTRAKALIPAGVPIEIVSKMLTHHSVTTTSETYFHLGAEDVSGRTRPRRSLASGGNAMTSPLND